MNPADAPFSAAAVGHDAPPIRRAPMPAQPWFGLWRGLLFALWPGLHFPAPRPRAAPWHARRAGGAGACCWRWWPRWPAARAGAAMAGRAADLTARLARPSRCW